MVVTMEGFGGRGGQNEEAKMRERDIEERERRGLSQLETREGGAFIGESAAI